MLHRDIKPDNILLSFNGMNRLPPGVGMEEVALDVKLVDFGLARVLGVDHSGGVKGAGGTSHYMAPEVLVGDHRPYSFPVRVCCPWCAR